LTAHDYVYSWRRVFDPEVGSSYEWMVDTMIKNGAAIAKGNLPLEDLGVTAIDDYTLQIELNMPVAYFLQIASFPTYKPVNQAFVEKYGAEYGTSVDTTLGNGPFVLATFSAGVELTYEKSENYWDKENVHLERIVRQIVTEENPRTMALLSGDIDSAGIGDPEWRAMVDADGRFDYFNEASASIDFFMFNAKNEFLQNKKIRQALSISFDREKFITEVDDDFGFPAYSTVPAVMHAGEELYADITAGKNEHIRTLINENPDPKELLLDGLEELGYARDASEMEITVITRGVSEKTKEMAEWLKQNWEEQLGFTLTIELTEWNIMWDKVDAGDYAIAMAGWGADVDDPSNMINIFHTDPNIGYYNGAVTGWSGPAADEFNALVEKAINTPDSHAAAEILMEAEILLLDEAVISPMTFGESSSYRGKYVKGLFHNNFTFIDCKGVYLDGK